MILNALSVTAHALSQVRPIYAISAALLYMISVVISGARWKMVLSGLGLPSRLKDTSAALLIGICVSNITPSSRISGEVCRITLIRKWAKIDLKRATISVLYDRIADFLPISVLFILSLTTLRTWIQKLAHTLVIPLIGLSILLLTFFIIHRRFASFRRWLEVQKGKLSSVHMNRRKFCEAVGYSSLVWAQDIGRLMIVSAAFHVILNAHQAATLSLVMLICSVFPSIGGLGPTEGGLTAALHLFGVSLETAVAITVLERSISYIMSTCLGCIALAALGGQKLLRQRGPQ